jgi:toxin FitB
LSVVRYLLDTNVVSELAKPSPSARVSAWIESMSPLDIAISVLTIGELAQGVRTMRSGIRRDELAAWVESALPRQFIGRTLPVDERVAIEWGRLSAEAKSGGRPLPVIDGLLLATAAVHKLTFVTRNEGDCAGRGIETLNPWR